MIFVFYFIAFAMSGCSRKKEEVKKLPLHPVFGKVLVNGKAAEKALHNSELGGRTITVNEARPKEDRPRRDFGGNGGGNGGGGSFRQRSW